MRFLLSVLVLMAACKSGADSAPVPSKNTPAPPVTAIVTPPARVEVPDAGATEREQTFLQGMEALCRSIDAVPVNEDLGEQQQQVARWIDVHVTNADVRELFTMIGDMPASQRSGMLKAASAKAGVQNCALAER